MPEPLPERLQRLLATVAAQTQRETTAANERLDALRSANDAELERVARDRGEPDHARISALTLLLSRHRGERTTSGLVLELMDDPDKAVAIEAIRDAPPFDPAVVERLRALAAGTGERRWAEAAMALARRKDRQIGRVLLGWVTSGDRAHFNVALSGLRYLAGPEEWRELLERLWERGGRDDEDGVTLATLLLEQGDDRGLALLERVARGLGPLSIHAADAVYGHDAAFGLELMAAVLDGAEPSVRWGMAERIARHADHPHLWTADALSEARNWVDRRREELG